MTTPHSEVWFAKKPISTFHDNYPNCASQCRILAFPPGSGDVGQHGLEPRSPDPSRLRSRAIPEASRRPKSGGSRQDPVQTLPLEVVRDPFRWYTVPATRSLHGINACQRRIIPPLPRNSRIFCSLFYNDYYVGIWTIYVFHVSFRITKGHDRKIRYFLRFSLRPLGTSR